MRARAVATLADLAGQQCSLANAIDSFEEIGVDYLRSGSDRIGLLTLSYARDIKRVLEELNAQYSLIILNGPSVTDGPDVFLLANCAHEILFSWRWGITRKNVARKALELFMTTPGPAHAIRSVLMRVDLKKKMLFEDADTRDLLRTSS